MGISAFWKARAREALRGCWLTALLITLVINLPSLLVQGIATVTGNDLLTRMQQMLYSSVSADGTAVDMQRLMTGVQEIQGSAGIWAMQGLNLLAWLLTPCLGLGLYRWLLGRYRKEEDPGVLAVFSRIRLFFPAIGLRLYTAWRVFLWMLPGFALMILAWLPLWLSDSSSRIATLSAANASVGLQSAAMIATLVLGVMAAMKYALGDLILADRPEMGPIRSAKESKRLMKGKRGLLLSLYLSFLFWYLLEMMATTLVEGLFGGIPALMVQLLISLALTAYVRGTVTAFYLSLPEMNGQASAEGAEETNLEEEDQNPWER